MKRTLLAFLLILLSNITYSKDVLKNELDRQLLLKLRNIDCTEDKNEVIKTFLTKKFSAKDDNGGLNLLILASAIGDLEAVKYLTNSTITEESIKDLQNIEWAFKYLWEKDRAIKDQELPYLRYQSKTGYTALTFAVVAGNYKVVEYLIDAIKANFKSNIKKGYTGNSSFTTAEVENMALSISSELTAACINRMDYNGWNSMAYAASFIPYCDNEDKILERIKILSTLIYNGGKNAKVNILEGERDLISLASRHGNYMVIKFFHKLYEEIYKNPLFNKKLEEFAGTKDEIMKSIEISLLDISNILDKEIIIDQQDPQEHILHYEKTIKELNEWLKDL
jgi:hypothetical protein